MIEQPPQGASVFLALGFSPGLPIATTVMSPPLAAGREPYLTGIAPNPESAGRGRRDQDRRVGESADDRLVKQRH